MRHYTALLLVVLGAGCWQQAASQYWLDTLYSDNGMPWRGETGEVDTCPPGSSSNDTSYAYALEFKFDDLDDLDFIGGDSVKLYCRHTDGTISGYITSLQGEHGEWMGIRSCPTNVYINGFRLRVYPEQGTWGDDFAVDNIQMACEDGTVLDGLEGVTPPSPYTQSKNDEDEDEDETNVVRKWVQIMGRWVETVRHRSDAQKPRLNGQWGTWAYCSPDLYVMGIRTTLEEGHIDDDAGLTDVTIYCA